MVIITWVLMILLALSYPAKVSEHYYIVQPGDTLSEIAHRYGLGWHYLADFNDLENPSLLRPGTRLRIPARKYVIKFTPEERELLAKVIHAEARGEPLEGQIAVGAVIINRVKSEKFPNTITEVVYQRGQFTPVERNLLPNEPQASAWEAAERALAGEDPTGGALFFYNPTISENPEYWKTRPVIKKIGNHNFAI
ncbi:MAG: LysM peptidoglycan-binding domain-containing protein [Firmicutes bacterium]|nr:LysM peptidoglycan-binding domain-containing protein [Bacillota bacterium]